MNNYERLGDIHPPIQNCRGGADGDTLLGNLTSSEIAAVKSAPVSRNIADQEALIKDQLCTTFGEKVEIAYFPQETFSKYSGFSLEICAMCLACNCPRRV